MIHIEEVIAANGAAILILTILLISRWMTRRVTRMEDLIFTILIYAAIGCNALELTSFLIDGIPGVGLRIFNILTHTRSSFTKSD